MIKNKKIIMLIFCIIFTFQCSTLDKGKKSSKTTITKSEDMLVKEKMNELKKIQDKIMTSGNSKEIDRVILENNLLNSFNKWKGTRYEWGGDSKSGIDCSAFTRRIYREVFNFELPRVSIEQVKVGKKISINNLRAGDILYFRPEGRVNHTAVYLGNSIFLNASTSKGVVLSSLESSYWGRYFQYAVRVVNV